MISKRIAMARKQKSWIQTQLADALGVSIDTVRRWEQGKRSPDADALQKLAHALNTSTGYLLGETDDPKRYASILGNSPELDGNKRPLSPAAAALLFPSKGDSLLGGSVSSESMEEAWDRAVNATPPNPYHMARVKVLPKEFRICCGKGVHWLDDTVEFESVIDMPDPDLVRFSPLIAIWAEGDSMEPDIQDGDMVIFTDNIYERELAGNGDIVLVNYNGRLIIRGLMIRGEKMSLRAFNRDEYEDIEIDPQKDDFEVLGRVLKVHRTWKPRPVF